MMRDKKQLRIAFVGCVEEGRECLQEILDSGGNVVAVFTFTDEIAQKTSGAVSFEAISNEHGVPLHKVKSTNTPEAIKLFRDINPDVIFVIGWTRLICKEVLEIPRLGCIGMHASLLPKYRGRAPVNWALINGEKETGNSVMLLNEGVDTGKIVAQKAIKITLADTCQTLYHKVAAAGRAMLREILPQLEKGCLPQIEQNEGEATEMPKRRPQDGIIDWQKNAMQLFNWVRALTHPYPGAFTFLRGQKLYIWEARIAHYPQMDKHIDKWQHLAPGTVMSINDGVAVLTGQNELLTLHRLQYEGGLEWDWHTFVNQEKLLVGEVFQRFKFKNNDNLKSSSPEKIND